jgi:hypothetical protein
LHDYEAALDLLAPSFERMRIDVVNWVKADPDLDPIRDHPRFKAMLAAAEARLAIVMTSLPGRYTREHDPPKPPMTRAGLSCKSGSV